MKRPWTLNKDLTDPERGPSMAPLAKPFTSAARRGFTAERASWQLSAWRAATGRQEPSPRISEPFLSSEDAGRVLMALGRRKLAVHV